MTYHKNDRVTITAKNIPMTVTVVCHLAKQQNGEDGYRIITSTGQKLDVQASVIKGLA